jgi:hypothetical protein
MWGFPIFRGAARAKSCLVTARALCELTAGRGDREEKIEELLNKARRFVVLADQLRSDVASGMLKIAKAAVH